MIALALGLFAAAVAWAAPRALPRARWVERAPRLGIAAWCAVLLAVTTSLVAAAALIVCSPIADTALCMAWQWCMRAAHGEFGWTGRAVATAATAAATVIAARLVCCGLRMARARAGQRRRHAQLVRLAGRSSTALGATVVECAEPAAYVASGTAHQVVVTSGALELLSAEQLAAVLAHERAHVVGRHALLLAGVRLLQLAFPRVGLFAAAHGQLSRLAELRADEVAAAHHEPLALARALVTMAGATVSEGRASVPPGAMAATGGETVERLHRLLTPPARLAPAQRLVVAAGIAGVAAGPALFVVAGVLLSTPSYCPVWAA
ncbi:M56 family metallopeptidase [Cryptosporangium minutisporangium]|uniref:M56 family metallopeptidase n=1 Tax=Cryptosporangium minutisporangium TaxID=113569 RepID=A0ABP6T213_9ACTN